MKKLFRAAAVLLTLTLILLPAITSAEEVSTEKPSASFEMPDGAQPGEMPDGFQPGDMPEGMPQDSAEDTVEATEETETETEDTAEDDTASYVEFDGTVTSDVSEAVITKVGGTVASVNARAGQKVEAGDVLAVLETEKVYATEDGTVSAVFGAEGDSTDVIANRYGAVLYIEPESGRYTISATTENAYDDSDNLYVHVGESVYLKCYSKGDHTGTGFVSAVSGDSYTVEVVSGTFKVGESVNVFRDSEYASKSRIGRGTCERGSDIAVGSSSTSSSGSMTGSGTSSSSIVAMHVQAGDSVKKGDVLYETLSGTYDAYYCTGNEILANASGILGSFDLSVGTAVNADDTVASIWPVSGLLMTVSVNEADLEYITAGEPCLIEFNWDDGETVYNGTVFAVSYQAEGSETASEMAGSVADTSDSDTASYTAYISFDAGEEVRVGMTATVLIEE